MHSSLLCMCFLLFLFIRLFAQDFFLHVLWLVWSFLVYLWSLHLFAVIPPLRVCFSSCFLFYSLLLTFWRVLNFFLIVSSSVVSFTRICLACVYLYPYFHWFMLSGCLCLFSSLFLCYISWSQFTFTFHAISFTYSFFIVLPVSFLIACFPCIGFTSFLCSSFSCVNRLLQTASSIHKVTFPPTCFCSSFILSLYACVFVLPPVLIPSFHIVLYGNGLDFLYNIPVLSSPVLSILWLLHPIGCFVCTLIIIFCSYSSFLRLYMKNCTTFPQDSCS